MEDRQIRKGVDTVSAVVAAENGMVVEDRIARLEADVDEIKVDVKALNARLNESILANARESGSLRTEMEKGFGSLRVEMKEESASLRTEMERGFGSLRAEMKEESASFRTEMEKSFGSLRAEMKEESGSLRTETEKSIGSLRADMEQGFGSLRTSIESAKLWMLVTGVGSVILMTFVTILGRVLKLF